MEAGQHERQGASAEERFKAGFAESGMKRYEESLWSSCGHYALICIVCIARIISNGLFSEV